MTTPDEFIYALIETAACATPTATVRELAQKMGLHEGTLGNWRRGKTAMPAEAFFAMWALCRNDELLASLFEELMEAQIELMNIRADLKKELRFSGNVPKS